MAGPDASPRAASDGFRSDINGLRALSIALVVAYHLLGRLVPGGLFAMSMERGDRDPYFLTDTGRYTHHPDHVRDVAAKAGLAVAHINESFLRMEYGEEVMGLYAILQKPG